MRLTAICLLMTVLLLPIAAHAEFRTIVSENALPEPWPASTPLVDVSNEGWNFIFSMPEGGVYLTEEEAGISPADDPMRYPVIWGNDGNELVFDAILLGIFDNQATVDEARFQEILAEENGNVGSDYPQRIVEPMNVDIAGITWTLTTMQKADGSSEISKLSSYGDSYYYSFSFSYPPTADLDLAWAQIEAIVASFGQLQYDEDY
jgi:hypothetical protein